MSMNPNSKTKTIISSVILTGGNSKESALRMLINEAAGLSASLTVNEIQQLVQDREEIATTLVSDNIAFPHAIRQNIDESLIVLGLSREPVLWAQPDQYVQIIVLFAGGVKQHLEAMSSAAKMLRKESFLDKILKADNQDELTKIISENLGASAVLPESESGADINTAFLNSARRLQSELDNCDLAVIDEVFSSSRSADSWYAQFEGWILTTRGNNLPGNRNLKTGKITIPTSEITFAENELKRLTIEGYFKNLDSLVLLFGEPASNIISSLKLINLQNREELRLIKGIPYGVSQRVLQLAREIGTEGREGKPVGCLFVVGEEDILKRYTHQLIVNPFAGYREEERNIIDPSLEETVKEFSKIDGAFIIKPDGTIKSAGTYIAISPQKLEHHPGEGARHASARGITAVAECLAVAVSESTGRVSVYAEGKRIL